MRRRDMARQITFGGLAFAVLAPAARPAYALFGAPKAELWPRWQAHDPASSEQIDHAPWAAFLTRYLKIGDDGIHRIDYGAVSQADRAGLRAYLDRLSASDVDGLNRAEQFAFWSNLYNALTVDTVLDAYPIESIRDIDISPGLFANGPWGAELIEVHSEALSLDDIEHRILRPIWGDPRVHYAVNCAALGCPNLQAEPFTGARLDDQLDAAARAFVNHPRGVTIDGERLVVSSIYSWFKSDFGGDDAGVIAHLRRHAAPDLAARLARFAVINDHRYDWRLNDTAGAA